MCGLAPSLGPSALVGLSHRRQRRSRDGWDDICRCDLEGHANARHRVRVRAVRRHVRATEREARSGRLPRGLRRPARGRCRVCRLRRRRDRPDAERSGHRGDPRPRELHAGPMATEPRTLRLRRHRRGRRVAVLPAHDPSARSRAGEGEGLRVPHGARARVLPREAARGRLDRDRRSVRHAREALLRHARPDPPIRLPDDGLPLLQRARLGQLRERPRGRERAVRAELHLRRRARLVRPRDLLPLHGAHARGAERDDRDVHAEAVLAPDGERLPLPHVALGRRHATCSSTSRTRAGLASRTPPTASSAACGRTRARTAA